MRDHGIHKRMLTSTEKLEGGLDTTASTLHAFLLAMVKYPDALRRAQEEVDSVCGTERVPTFQDARKLPYISACITETERWRPVVPGGLPHMVTEDDVYEGYFIPAGTMIFSNAYSIQHDETEYETPEEFRPERWLDNKFGTLKADSSDNAQRRTVYGFGGGRRACPGQHLAEQSMFINVAKIVWCFNITSPDHTLLPDSYEKAWTPYFLTGPERFPCIIKPRSPKHVEAVELALKQAQGVLEKYDDVE